jgi:hypothetical protein
MCFSSNGSSMKKIEYNRKIFCDPQNRPLITGLFKETKSQHVDPKYAVFSLEDWRKVYVECRDVTEYKPAMALVGDWKHWSLLRNNEKLKPYFDAWQEEVETQLKMEAIELLKEHAKAQGGTAAAKWLAEGQYKSMKIKEPKKPVGRPVQDEEDTSAQDTKKIQKDLGRLGLVMGGKA